jgi:dynein heavy chain
MVYVFKCSDQMDYKSMGQIYKGLASSGSWGCFDEFNRIDVAVLSVVSTQLKCVLDAVKNKKTKFNFEDDEVAMKLDPVCFPNITNNPGYAGRTELPESVKALFRPCAMIVPDMDMITEIMLMSEGFAEGKILSRKFMILYRLNEALLSQSKHYDWKLRAVKTTLNVAGAMRRQDRSMSEDRVLLRALRDFNLGKLIADDVGIFMGLLNDLFPKIKILGFGGYMCVARWGGGFSAPAGGQTDKQKNGSPEAPISPPTNTSNLAPKFPTRGLFIMTHDHSN